MRAREERRNVEAVPEQNHRVAQAARADLLLEHRTHRSLARAEHQHVRDGGAHDLQRLDEIDVSLHRVQVRRDEHARAARSPVGAYFQTGHGREKRCAPVPIELLEINPVVHHDDAIGGDAFLRDAHVTDRFRVCVDSIRRTRRERLQQVICARVPVAQIEATRDDLDARQARGRNCKKIRVEVVRMHEPDALARDVRRQAKHLVSRVELREAPAQAEFLH